MYMKHVFMRREKEAVFKGNYRHTYNRSTSYRGSAFIQFVLPLPKLES
jgi:hypothetical protein